MKSGLSYLARGVLLTGTLIGADAQPDGCCTIISNRPPSGVLVTQPPAPVAVPPSGVLVTPPTDERHAIATELVKTGQNERTLALLRTTASAAWLGARRVVVSHRAPYMPTASP
jgi:hypothetical protein